MLVKQPEQWVYSMTGDVQWRRAMLRSIASVKTAIENLDNYGLQIILVVDEDGKLIGTLSDGDIRRGLLKGVSLDHTIAKLVNCNPMVVPENLSLDMVFRMMIANKVRQIPIVNGENKAVGLHLWERMKNFETIPNTLVVMAGGKGTRLRPFTEECPKPMLHVAGKPMMEHIIQKAVEEGFRSFVISLGYLGHIIENYFGDGKNFGIDVSYIREDEPLGTAGALSLLENSFKHPFVVTNGDVITNVQYAKVLEFHVQNLAFATMAVHPYQWQNPFGVVNMKGVDIVGFEEKPIISSHVNAGVYALSPETLGYLPRGERCDMPALFEMLRLKKKRVVAYPMHEEWIDVGRPADLQAVNDNHG